MKLRFIKSTNHGPTDHRPTDHRPLTHRPNDAVIMFKAFENSMIITLQNISTSGKIVKRSSVYYLENL